MQGLPGPSNTSSLTESLSAPQSDSSGEILVVSHPYRSTEVDAKWIAVRKGSVWASRFKKIITGRPTFGARRSVFPPPIHELKSIFRDEELFRRLMEYEAADAQRLLDSFQQLLDKADLDLPFRKNLIIATQRLSSKTELAPNCFMLEGVTQVGQAPARAEGAAAKIYKGTFRDQVVCLRALRISRNSQVEHWEAKYFWREAMLWGQLSHPNVIAIYGIYIHGSRKFMVVPWMENEDIRAYLAKNPSAPRALDVASGLKYLHDNDIIHRCLTNLNVLVDGAGRARLNDFYISCVSNVTIVPWGEADFSISRGGYYDRRWQAPEVLKWDVTDSEEKLIMMANSKEGDIYTWGCVAWEIFTGETPFNDMVGPGGQAGLRLARPESSSPAWKDFGLTEEIWACMEQCWEREPSIRPSAATIVKRLEAGFSTADPRPRTGAGGRLAARWMKVRYRELWDSLKIRQAKAATLKSFKSEPDESNQRRLKELRKISVDIQNIRQEMNELDVPFTFKLQVFFEDLPPPVNKLRIYEWTRGEGRP
ncbi:hypothetical protein DXG01_011287 [Tephrocybe rancida]|nr:hypothetical protein DXG01_011287 [Tephrocybe rancida]